MPEANGKYIISNWQKTWKRSNVLSLALLALAAALFLSAIFHLFFPGSFWLIVPLFLIFATIAFSTNPSWKITVQEVARYLNHLIF
jgi:uncharacterized membrane protein YesL